MNIDYALWRVPSREPISRGLAYCLLCAGVEFDEVAPVPAGDIAVEIDTAFPDRSNPDSEQSFEYEIRHSGIVVTTWSSTSPLVLEWFARLADRHSLTLFDPQREGVTSADTVECDRRMRQLEADDYSSVATGRLPSLRAGASAGDIQADLALAHATYFGEGLPTDMPRAFALYLRAAQAGSEEGMFNVASCYLKGEGTPRDLNLAIRWFKAAAATDHFFAPFALGELYASGEGSAPDLAEAERWFRVALANGHQEAPKALRSIGALRPSSSGAT